MASGDLSFSKIMYEILELLHTILDGHLHIQKISVQTVKNDSDINSVGIMAWICYRLLCLHMFGSIVFTDRRSVNKVPQSTREG